MICPLIPQVFLVGGLEFGHAWRRIEGECFIFCKKCYLKVHISTYAADSEPGRFYIKEFLLTPKTDE